MENVALRPAKERDAQEMLAIYGDYVRNTVVTSEYDVPAEEEFQTRIYSILKRTPWLVCEVDGQIAGYAYASPHRPRAAYQWSVETSIYVSPAYQGRRVATALYTALFALLKELGYFNIHVGITTRNPASIAFHKAMGFVKTGEFHNAMYKFGAWEDVIWMGRTLRDFSEQPAPLKLFGTRKDSELYRRILQEAAALIKKGTAHGEQ